MAQNLDFQPVWLQSLRSSNIQSKFRNRNTYLSNSGAENSLETFTTSRLIPPSKNPGVRPIGVVEILCQITGKVIMYIAKKDEKDAGGLLQLCTGHEAGHHKHPFMQYMTFSSKMKLKPSFWSTLIMPSIPSIGR